MSLIIAGDRSGVGKTTITLALLAFISRKNLKIQSFKVGPDYIDPMFHTAITGRPCRNLDPILTSEEYIKSCFATHCQTVEYGLVEGVMGLFDGVNVPEKPRFFASTAHIAELLNLPVVLVIDCSRLSGSVAAIAHGYRSLNPQIKLTGVILNRVASDRHLNLLQEALIPLNLPILGVLPRQDSLTIPDRHLGLVTTDELTTLDTLFEQLAALAATHFDWETLLPLMRVNSQSYLTPRELSPLPQPVTLGVARDRAFNFYYPDNLEILEQLGAKIRFWSPLADADLPPDCQGLYFGGGFPEMWGESLAENQAARAAIRNAIDKGMPTYAECGGLMYLCQEIEDFNGKIWPMVGVLPTRVNMSGKLTLGYRYATALQDSCLLKSGEIYRGHEFHRSQLTLASPNPLWKTQGVSFPHRVSKEGWQQQQIHASYIHLHFGGFPEIAERFLKLCHR